MEQSHRDKSRDGHRARLRQRYMRAGISALSDYEVVEMLLMLAIPRIDVKPIAKEMLAKFKNIRGVLEASNEDLLKIKGIGENALCAIKLTHDIITLYHTNELECGGEEISTISKLMKYFKSKISAKRNEVLEMVCFDAKLKVIPDACITLFEGSVNSANVDIRKIVEIAIRKGASSIAIAHNHPSGDPRPSLEDVRFTRRLSEACKPINLNFIEHIIVGKNTCFSFRRDGRFDDLYDESLEEGRLRSRARVADKLESLDGLDALINNLDTSKEKDAI